MKGGLLTPDKLERVKDLFVMLPRIIFDEEIDEFKPALEEFLNYGGYINYENGILLLTAVRVGNLAIIKLLLENGARVDVNTEEILIEAVYEGDLETLGLLLDTGVRTDLFEKEFLDNKRIQDFVKTRIEENNKKKDDPESLSLTEA
mgnify:CR=1 FL=1